MTDNPQLPDHWAKAAQTTAGIAEADDWAGQFNSRKTALIDSDGWTNNPYTTEESSDHLF